MLRFLIGRLGLLVAGLLLASVLVFLVLRVLPGDVAQVIGGTNATPAQIAAIRESLGLDAGPVSQYLSWLAGLVRFDLGDSLITGTPVGEELGQKFQVTLPLTLLALVVGLVIALPLGVLSAVRAERGGGAINVAAQALAAVPALWAGLLLILLLGRGVGLVPLLPTQGFPRDGWADPSAALAALVLPALTIGVIEGAVLLRFVRSATLEALAQDYVRTAAAKGLTRTRALLTHGLPNVGLSIISVTALTVAGLITGAVLVESLFNLPGVGRMLVSDVGNRDLVKVQSEILFLTAIVLVIGAVVDVVHRVLDPRLREAGA
ncbi:ABC transporter permease [Galbitalea sp. SE-J8]|uniref:ABC transporter permease n=1 Tax=Galbitalea sp. SE-J8 TaxID=3054952 RepID=UPI00259CD7FB|nr:ABC transporter permease [Galbitalea sp. SE-J8]MDM4761611.1 ABC transporter permease [Galbitalea sp. SE-J8]